MNEAEVEAYRKELAALQAACANFSMKFEEQVKKEQEEAGAAPNLNPGTKETEEQKKAREEAEKAQKAAAARDAQAKARGA